MPTYLTGPNGVAVPDATFDGINPVVLPPNVVVEINPDTPPWAGLVAELVASGQLTPTSALPATTSYATAGAAVASLPATPADGTIVSRVVTNLGALVFAYHSATGWTVATDGNLPHARVAVGVKGDNVTDDTQALLDNLAQVPPGGALIIPPVPSAIRTTAPIPLYEQRQIIGPWAGVWPYLYGSPIPGSIKPRSTFVGDAVFLIEGQEITGRPAVMAGAAIRNLVIDCSAIPGAQNADGVRMQGLCRDITLDRVVVAIPQGQGAGVRTFQGAGAMPPRGLRLREVTTYGSDVDGFHLLGATDSTFTDCLAVGNAEFGWMVQNSGENTFVGCRAVFNGASGFEFGGSISMGLTTLINPATDRNGWHGISITQTGHQPIQIVAPRLRRDGSASATGDYAALCVEGTSGNLAVPVEVTMGQTTVGQNDPDDVDGPGIESPQWAVSATYAQRVNLIGGEWWGVDGGIRNGGSAEIRFSRATRFHSGPRTAKVRTYPDVVQGEGETIVLRATAETWSSMPAAATEFLGATSRRVPVDLTGRNFVRWWVGMSVAGAAGSTLKLQATTDLTGATGWTDLTGTVAINATGLQLSAWTAIPDALKAFVLIRPQGAGGNGSTSPAFTGMGLAVRV